MNLFKRVDYEISPEVTQALKNYVEHRNNEDVIYETEKAKMMIAKTEELTVDGKNHFVTISVFIKQSKVCFNINYDWKKLIPKSVSISNLFNPIYTDKIDKEYRLANETINLFIAEYKPIYQIEQNEKLIKELNKDPFTNGKRVMNISAETQFLKHGAFIWNS